MPAYEAWQEWLPEAHQTIQRWKAGQRMLTTIEAVSLAEAVAQALWHAFELGRGQREREDR